MQESVLRAALINVYDYFHQRGHRENMRRVKELAQKLQAGEYGIAFAGHFSAGKSRMINSLLGENILPSSPIPTSANLVKVYRGQEDYARVYFQQEKPRKYLAPYDYDLIRSFCKDGDRIRAIELSRRELSLPEQVVIMDTPGIDSADDAHRKATEAAIHLADVILYVMDYNHVQAELNLSFTRELTAAGKEVYLLVNQIDKHVEKELSFADFQKGTEAAFAAWGVQPAGFFYTSLKYPDLPHNQFAEVKKRLWERIDRRHELLLQSVEASLAKILREYAQEQQEERQAQTAGARAVLAELSEAKLAQCKADYARLAAEQAELGRDWEPEFNAGVEKILSNAYLMPTSTRDLARDYLIACQPDFKVGFFGRGKKTMAEIERRKQAFFDDAVEKTQAQLSWHIKTYFTNFAKERQGDSPELLAYVQQLEILPPEQLLTEAMRSGAKLTQDGSYVMNYTANFAEGTKNVARRFAGEYKKKLQALLTERNAARQEEIARQLAALEEYHQAWSALDEAVAAENRLTEELDRLRDKQSQEIASAEKGAELFAQDTVEEEIILPEAGMTDAAQAGTESAVAQQVPEAQESTVQAGEEQKAGVQTLAEATVDQASGVEQTDGSKLGQADTGKTAGKAALLQWAEKLRYGSRLIGHIPALQQMAGELADRADRLENKGFMVTLFGAFSAGKSSFANSLLGTGLLPVSPNPTTAAINKISPPDGEHPHGTLVVQLKDEAMILADVNRALGAFGLKAASLSDARACAEKAVGAAGESSYGAKGANTQEASHGNTGHGYENNQKGQREKAFLRAFLMGLAPVEDKLGTKLTATMEDLPVYAAQEDKSCFVDWLEVYYDCPLTKLGITLVDTPGADSINARHTNMSFNYIRQSDAVLFVTYYNHAFSKADREFLIQLGRVKDAFALDKMFFIVNAIDLAEDEEEAQGVVDYVAMQLKKYGVKRPRMFGLSSRQILQEKLAGKTAGFEFEDAFYRFVFEELAGMALNGAAGEYARLQRRVKELLTLGKGDAASKEQRRQRLLELQQQSGAVLERATSGDMQHAQQQEAQELLYYVKQRVFLRYMDFYRESFNPAVFMGKQSAKQQLDQALGELLHSMGFDFAQELRATGLRMEQFIKKQADALQDQLNGRLRELAGNLPVTPKEFPCDCGLEYVTAFQEADRGQFAKALAIYKNPKSFFEQGGSKIMAAELEKILEGLAESYLAEQSARLAAKLETVTKDVFNQVVARHKRHLQAKFHAYFTALEGGIPVAELEEIAQKLA